MMPSDKIKRTKAYKAGRVEFVPQERKPIKRRLDFLGARPSDHNVKLFRVEYPEPHRPEVVSHQKRHHLREFIEKLKAEDPKISYKEQIDPSTDFILLPEKKFLLETFTKRLSRRGMRIEGLLHDFKVLTEAETHLTYAELLSVLDKTVYTEDEVAGRGTSWAEQTLAKHFRTKDQVFPGLLKKMDRDRRHYTQRMIFKIDSRSRVLYRDFESRKDGTQVEVYYKKVDLHGPKIPITQNDFRNLMYYVDGDSLEDYDEDNEDNGDQDYSSLIR